jgi:hypothetical protein
MQYSYSYYPVRVLSALSDGYFSNQFIEDLKELYELEPFTDVSNIERIKH